MSEADETTVRRFNEAINGRNLDALTRLMADDHRFVDAAGAAVDGKAACVDAWRGFFGSFPDYRNTFEVVDSTSHGVVEVRGRSDCSVPELAGPARWRAVVRDGRIVEWRVSDDPGA
jgi:ketosteroid isomerase-like protein